jgi:hypothetical protein
MDIEKFIKLFVDYVSEYLYVFGATLRRPVLRFLPLQESQSTIPNQNSLITELEIKELTFRVNPKLFTFAIISIFISIAIQSLIASYQGWERLIVSSVIILIFWITCACLIYLVCKIIRVKGVLITTVSICIQVLSVSYVVCNLITLISIIIMKSFVSSDFQPLETQFMPVHVMLFSSYYLIYQNLENYKILLQQPFLIYFHLQMIFLSVYLPWSIKVTYNVSRVKTLLLYLALITVIVIPFVAFGISFYEVNAVVISPTR